MRVCRPAWPLSVIPLPAPWGLVSIEVNESFTRENGGRCWEKSKPIILFIKGKLGYCILGATRGALVFEASTGGKCVNETFCRL